MDKKIKLSIWVIVALTLMEIIGLILYDLQVHYLLLSFYFCIGALLYITFLLQFKNNFKRLLGITTLDKNITAIILCFIIASAASIIIVLEYLLFPGNYPYDNTLRLIYNIFNITSTIAEIVIIVPCLLLAAKLRKVSPIDEVQKLAMAYYFIPLYYLGSIISFEYNLEIIKYAALVFQLLPYLYTYKAYIKLQELANINVNSKA